MKIPVTFIQSLFSVFFLWFGLYILTRRKSYLSPFANWWKDPSFSIGLLMVLTSWQLFGVAMRSEALTPSNYQFWVQTTWWVSPISMFLWFYSSVIIFEENTHVIRSARDFWLITLPVGIVGIALAGAGTFTEWLFLFSDIHANPSSVTNPFIVQPGRGGIFYLLYQVVLSFSPLPLIALARKQIGKNQLLQSALRLTMLGNLYAAIGITIIIISGFLFNLLIPEQFGDFLLTIGFILIAISVIQYNAAIQKRIPYTDLWRSLGGVFIANLFYLSFFELFLWRYVPAQIQHAATRTSLIYLTTLIHTPLEWGKSFLDRLVPAFLILDWEKEYLKKIDQVQYEILTTPDPQITLENIEKQLRESTLQAHHKKLKQMILNEIETIFRYKGFEKDSLLAQSKLFKLQIVSTRLLYYAQNRNIDVQSLTPSNRAESLRDFLTEIVSQLCPPHQSPSTIPLPEHWIECLILTEKYIANKSRKEVETIIRQYGYLSSEGAYSRFLQNGRQLLSELILEKELDDLAVRQE